MGQKELRLQLAYRVSVNKDSESISLNSVLTMFRKNLNFGTVYLSGHRAKSCRCKLSGHEIMIVQFGSVESSQIPTE